MLENAAARAVRVVASYACDPLRSPGRAVEEEASRTRSAFQRDRDRILHSTAFRRLKFKTQVFVYHEGDHYRTRLTHTLEVSQIARSLARSLGFDEDLAEAIALAHDLGHSPFGHAGERALQRVATDIGGFDHNTQSLRVVTRLERRYAEFDGLNLTFETLEGIVKHNGPVMPGAPTATGFLLDWAEGAGVDLSTFAPGEAQAAAIADDIAYNSHDIDDGLRAGLFTVDELCAAVPLVRSHVEAIRQRYPDLSLNRLTHEIVRRLITGMVEDALSVAMSRIDAWAPATPDDLRNAGAPVLAFSPAMMEEVDAMRRFLFRRMYRHQRVMAVMDAAERLVEQLYGRLVEDPRELPGEWPSGGTLSGEKLRRTVCDYIAGMTDRYAVAEYERLFDAVSELR
ncbi:deoxyguanosinetriphosphate triphosphohydrolase [Lutibaculum baratangense]|uniref:Deoxyguanosinetriphosphate triphosphohydrolase-like protein n=1 Tax=Lutibaculum baratangense AMV1 TaxID=631454 RepID=V4QUW5_9HYPH|nr:deoxyguanosinetriphosphate triphosphohydrolase [Lutibaculum baratangense]ESR23537.1 Deoxyguanosinetriphosphate triphosphohydrolase [Lutibaculum baratangense AMV1]